VNRIPANFATLMNGVCGIWAIYSALSGNDLWAGLMIVCGLGFDGLDGFLSRRAGGPPSLFGRVADSVSDAVTFGVAPATLVLVHTADPSVWAPYAWEAGVVAGLLVLLAVARLTYFTAYAYHRSDFLGVPTPQTALAVVVLVIWADVPAYAGIQPLLFLILAAAFAVMMVVPIPYPKIRRGAPLRLPMTVTALALVVAELPLQLRPSTYSGLWDLTVAATAVATAGIALYYLAGPFTVAPPPGKPGDADG
jgi:CDP-diacylglycerol--serine O-phosphatidyltransferase